MNSLDFVRRKHSPLNKGRQKGIFYKTLITNYSSFERRRELGEIVKNPPIPFIKGEMYSFPSPTTGEKTKWGGFKKKFHSIPSPLGRELGGGFTLVELIVVVTILAILGTISFIALQGYSQDTRDAKRISDVRSLISKITIENTKGISYSEIINEGGIGYKKNTLKINGEENKDGYQNTENPINRDVLKENKENFSDPTNKHPYPFAYAVGNSNGQGYNFIQLAYVEEKTGTTKLVGNYYEMLSGDSPSLFTNTGSSGTNIPYDYIIENGEPIYDIGVIPPTTVPTPTFANCEANSDVNGYNVPTTNNGSKTAELTRTGALSGGGENGYSNYSQSFTCNNGTFIPNGEIENAPTCDENYVEQGEVGNYTCIEIEQEIKASTRYLVFEVFDHIGGNGAVINEIDVFDLSNDELSYTPTNAYDSVQGNIPHYWNDNNLWDKSNLKDNATTYGSANSTIFLYNSSANTDKWARFTVDLGVEKFVRDVDIYVAGGDSRTPKSITLYIVSDKDINNIYNENIKVRDDVGLTKIKELNFDTILTTSTKFNIPIYLPPAPTIQTHYNIVGDSLNLNINATHKDGISIVKYSLGVVDDIEYFHNKGTVINNSDTITNAGPVYTIYAKSVSGAEKMVVVNQNTDISLNGDYNIELKEGEVYSELGATYTGDKNASIQIIGNVDTSTVGKYIITYKAVDESNNVVDMVNRYVEVIPFSNYFIIEVFDHFESNGAAICELELYNKSNEKINYTVMNVCDSNNGNGIPTYWVQRPNIWDKPNLYDGEIIYTSNSVGAENCTLFLYGSSANSEKWARFLVYSGSDNISVNKFRLAIGDNVDKRTPKQINIYSVNNYDTTSTYNNNIKTRNNNGLTLVGNLNWTGNVSSQRYEVSY